MQFFTHDVDKKLQKCLQLIQQLEARYQAYMTMQQNLCKKDQKVGFFSDLGATGGKEQQKMRKSKGKKGGVKKKKSKPSLKAKDKIDEVIPKAIVKPFEKSLKSKKSKLAPVAKADEKSVMTDAIEEGEEINKFFQSLNIETEIETEETAPITAQDAP